MTPKQRIYLALRHRQPDICPYQLDFTIPAHDKMVAFTGDSDFAEKIGNHLVRVEPLPPDAWVEIKPNFWRDQFGVIWNRTIDKDIGNPEGLIFAQPSGGDYQWPDPQDPRRWTDFGEKVEAAGNSFVLMDIGFSLFERAWTMRGMVNLMIDMYQHPAFVAELLDYIVQFNLGLIEKGCTYNIDGVRFGDDWGQQQGMLMGPVLWRRFIKPPLRQMYGAVKDAGLKVFIHSCGNIVEVLPDLIELGVDVFNPFQPEVMDVYQTKRHYGHQLTFWGGVSTQQLLPYGTPEQVKAEARQLIREIGRDGGYIIAPAHDIPQDVPPENIAALIEVLQAQ